MRFYLSGLEQVRLIKSKRTFLLKNILGDKGRTSNQTYEIFPALFYLLNNTTFMKVVERGAYG